MKNATRNLFYLLVSTSAIAACSHDPIVSVTGITLSADTVSLQIYSDTTVDALITPTNASIQSVEWSTSDAAVATVDAYGNIHGESPGIATITATTVEKMYPASCTVFVYSYYFTFNGNQMGMFETALYKTPDTYTYYFYPYPVKDGIRDQTDQYLSLTLPASYAREGTGMLIPINSANWQVTYQNNIADPQVSFHESSDLGVTGNIDGGILYAKLLDVGSDLYLIYFTIDIVGESGMEGFLLDTPDYTEFNN